MKKVIATISILIILILTTLQSNPMVEGDKDETNVLAVVNKFVLWIWKNVQIPHSPVLHEVPLYPNETLQLEEGDCDDQAILLITLCRIYGIPSYLQTGCIYMPEQESLTETFWDGHATVVLKRTGWHGWAMVYVPPWGWLPFDLTYVIGGKGDPLNAIKTSAVILRKTIQWMNISQTDYVALARKQRDFVKSNNFYIYEEDEITQETPTDVNFMIQTTVTIFNNGTRPWNFTEEDRTLSLFMNNTWQSVKLINHSYSLEKIKTDEDGNPVAVLQFPKLELQPGENISCAASYYATWKPRSVPNINEGQSETLNQIPQNLTEYCREEGPWLLSDPELRDLAQNVAQNEDFWEEQLPWIFITMLTATAIIAGVVVWNVRRKRLKEVNQPADLGSQQSRLHKLPPSLQHH